MRLAQECPSQQRAADFTGLRFDQECVQKHTIFWKSEDIFVLLFILFFYKDDFWGLGGLFKG